MVAGGKTGTLSESKIAQKFVCEGVGTRVRENERGREKDSEKEGKAEVHVCVSCRIFSEYPLYLAVISKRSNTVNRNTFQQ